MSILRFSCVFVLLAFMQVAYADDLILDQTDAGQSATCDVQQLSRIVTQTNLNLKRLQDKHKKRFRSKLQDLKQKHGWDDQTFLIKAAPFVQNDRTRAFDKEYKALLSEIAEFKSSSGQASEADCTLLIQLSSQLRALVEITEKKWAYMFGVLEAELRKVE